MTKAVKAKRTPLTPSQRAAKIRSWISSYIMVIPAICFLCVFAVYPAFNMVQLSLYQGSATKPYKKFLGLGNYEKLLFVKDDFWVAMRNTAVYTAWIVVLLIFFSVVFANWLFHERKINRLAQSVFFLPHLVAGVSCGFIWGWMMSGMPYGLFNTFLGWFGISPIQWLSQRETAMGGIIAMNTWKSIGYYALIVLSALKSIPMEIYEAAELDHSGPVRTFCKITLPMLTPQLFFLLITITTGSFKVFDSVRIMTNGGPGDATRTISMYIYDYAFQRNNSLGMAAASGVMLMVILMFVTWLDFGVVEKKVHYQ